jgi:hypothetical protein
LTKLKDAKSLRRRRRIRYVGRECDGKTEIGLEFSSPQPTFWRVHFPPEEWTLKSPEARKSAPVMAKDANRAIPEPPPAKS